MESSAYQLTLFIMHWLIHYIHLENILNSVYRTEQNYRMFFFQTTF